MLLGNFRPAIAAATILALGLAGSLPAHATATKEQIYQEMLVLADQLRALKSRLASDPSAAAEYATAFDRYRELSRQMGGDDPGHLGEHGVGPERTSNRREGNRAVFAVPSSSPPQCTATTTNITNTTPVAIPTGPAVVTSTLNVTGAGTYLWDLDLTTNITHTFAADLDITIQSPAGTVVTLTTDNGAGNDNVFNGTLWDDQANPGGQVPYTTNNGLVTDHAYVNNVLASPLVPEEALGAFNGENPNGTWTLTISDDLAGDGGSLDSWTLNFEACSCAINAINVDHSITKTDGLTSAAPGQAVTYTITANNAGPQGDPAAVVADTFPAGLTGATWTCVGAGSATCTASGAGNINDTVNLPSGGSVTYTVTGTIGSAFVGTLTNTATVTAGGAVTDTNPANNSATDITTVAASADLSVTKADTPDPVTPGTNLTYTITVNNAGPSNAASASLSDPLPAGTTFVSLSSPGGWSCTTPAVGVNDSVSCATASLDIGGSAVFTLVARVDASATAGFSNTATVSSATPDGNSGNNSATATTAVVSLPTTAQGDAGGGLVTAAITGGTCAGFAPGSTAFTAAPTPLPPGITFPYGVFGFTAVCPSGGTVTLTLTYPNPLPGGTQYWKYGPTSGNPTAHWYVLPATITGNTAVFTITDGGLGDDDLDPNNGVIVDQGGPGVPGAGNGAAAIPTLSEWALILFSVLLGSLVWRARRRVG